MLKNFLVCFFVFFLLFREETNAQKAKPKLIVGLVIDQMRWDYLHRYEKRYSKNGFKRLLRQGYSFDQTYLSYMPSLTAIGHASIFTGSVPAIHGIVGNEWYDQQTGKMKYCVEDSLVHSVGTTSNAGKMSPRNLLATTITDELLLATNFRSKVIGISLKDRAAILPAGHRPTGAFWIDDTSGDFVTSSWYMNSLPSWVQQFNNRKLPKTYMEKGWETLYPIDTYIQSTKDEVVWERPFPKDKKTSFPYDTKRFYEDNPGLIRNTPFGNTLILEFAKAALAANEMGKGNETDFLSINCASTDYVGHQFSTNSVEIEDTYLRLDRDLENFFTYLDKTIGKDNYLLFLTADHGGAHAVNYLREHKFEAGLLQSKTFIKPLNLVLEEKFGVKNLVKSIYNYQVNYNHMVIAEKKLDFPAIKRETINFLKFKEGVQYVIDNDDIENSSAPERLREMVRNGYNYRGSGSVTVIPFPGWFDGPIRGGTHGVWNPADTHIPLIFMGWNISKGNSNKKVNVTDIAPTLASMLNIQVPNGCIGEVLKFTK